MRLALYQPDIAGNTGTMLRLGACMDVGVDIIEPCGFPLGDRTLKRAAMDYGDRAEVVRHRSWELFCQNRPAGRLILASAHAAQNIWEFDWRSDDIILMGSETAGVPDDVRQYADAAVTIMMPGGGRSLNVALAAAMVLGEAIRRVKLEETL